MRVASCVIRGRIMGYAAISSTSIYRSAVTAHVHWCCMHMVTTCANAGSMAVARKFSDSILRRSLPQVSTNIRLHVVMGFVITSIAYSNSMNMGTCCIGRIGICAITITTTGNTSVRFVRTTKGKCV